MNKCCNCTYWTKFFSKEHIDNGNGTMDIGLCSKLKSECGNHYFSVELEGCSNAYVNDIETGSEFCCSFFEEL